MLQRLAEPPPEARWIRPRPQGGVALDAEHAGHTGKGGGTPGRYLFRLSASVPSPTFHMPCARRGQGGRRTCKRPSGPGSIGGLQGGRAPLDSERVDQQTAGTRPYAAPSHVPKSDGDGKKDA